AAQERTHLPGVGDLGAEVGSRPGVHQADELRMKRLRLGAQSLELLAVAAEKRSKRHRYLVLSRSRNASGGSGCGRGGFSQPRMNTRQVLGILNQTRRHG